MVVTDRDQHKKKSALCVSQEAATWGEVVTCTCIPVWWFPHIYSARHSFLVIQLFIAVVLKHWIRIKPRNGRRMKGAGGGGVIYMQYQSNDFNYICRLHVYWFSHSKRHNFLIMKLFIIVVLIHWIIIMERGLKDRMGRKDWQCVCIGIYVTRLYYVHPETWDIFQSG